MKKNNSSSVLIVLSIILCICACGEAYYLGDMQTQNKELSKKVGSINELIEVEHKVAYDEGWDVGYKTGADYAYEQGYRAGYQKGLTDSNTNGYGNSVPEEVNKSQTVYKLSGKREVYHTNKDCFHIKGKYIESIKLSEALDNNMRKCKDCP